MAEFPINRGIGSSVEFQGLKAQYLYIFIGGLLGLFILFVVLYLVGVPQWLCFAIVGAGAALLVWQVFSLNAKYGQYGLMKRGAKGCHPRYIINRRKISRLFNQNSKR
ncbi:MAG: DUF4133 domain-containing protein [Rikenellaceae bacterium]